VGCFKKATQTPNAYAGHPILNCLKYVYFLICNVVNAIAALRPLCSVVKVNSVAIDTYLLVGGLPFQTQHGPKQGGDGLRMTIGEHN
jgi:hypothetical protein